MRRKKADLVEEVVALRAALESERDIGPTDVAQERGSLPGEELFTGEDRAGLWPMIDSSPVGVSIIRPDGMILYINSALAELVGVEQHEVVGKDTQVLFFDPADRDPFLAKIERDGGIEGLERQIQRSDGEEFWISLTTRIHQMNGQEVWVTWAHDVTDEHRQTEKLRDLLDTVPCTVVVSSAETSELLFVNEFAHETTGLRVGGGQFTQAYKNPEDRDQLVEKLRRDGRVDNFEVEINARDGSDNTDWVGLSARMIEFEGQRASLVVSQFITDRKRAEQGLREREARLFEILESSPIGVGSARIRRH
tara:strand:- start:1406 stop:2329 length:924 start_codon:yes stop_codon:yes gene_type:complete